MTKKSTLLHDSSIVIRLPKALHEQLEQVATSQYMKMGELVRNLIKEEIKRALPYIGNAQPQTPQQHRGKPIPPALQAMSPAERKAWEDEWTY